MLRDLFGEGISDGIFFGIVVELSHGGTFILFTLFYLAIGRMRSMDKYRIRPKTEQPAKLVVAAAKNILFAHAVAVPYLAYLVWPVLALRDVPLSGPAPSFATGALQILGSMLIEDTMFYWIHRLLHHRLLYKHIHKMHHQFNNTESYAAEYSSAIEQTISNVMPFYAGPFVFRMHINVICVWMFLRLWETFDGHSGFVLPWSPWNAFLSIQGGAERHDFHHSHNAGSYGSLFKFWDWFMGTDKDFKEWQHKQRLKQQAHQQLPQSEAGATKSD